MSNHIESCSTLRPVVFLQINWMELDDSALARVSSGVPGLSHAAAELQDAITAVTQIGMRGFRDRNICDSNSAKEAV